MWKGTPTAFFTAGAMVSNLADIKTWLEALRNGTLISPEMHKEQLSFASPNTESYGLGAFPEISSPSEGT